MQKRTSILQTLLLLFLIMMLLLLMYASFIAGPLRAYEKEDRLHLEALVKNTDYKSARFLDRFKNEGELYYIALVDEQKNPEVVVFKKDLSEIKTFPYVSKETVASKMNIKLDEIHFAYLENRLVFIVRNDQGLQYIDSESLLPLDEVIQERE